MPGFHYIPLPFFRCRFAVPVCRCRFRTPLPLPFAVAAAVAHLFAVYGCNGTEFSYVTFTEQRNFAERRNGNGRTATEWWKLGIISSSSSSKIPNLALEFRRYLSLRLQLSSLYNDVRAI